MVDKPRDIRKAAEEIEELFTDLWQVFPFSRGTRGYRPQVDVIRTKDPEALVVHVELPGIDPAELNVIAAQRALVITGERRRPKDCHYQQMEIEYGPFQRKVLLGEDIDPETASASYERGILRITLPVVPTPLPHDRVTIRVRMTR